MSAGPDYRNNVLLSAENTFALPHKKTIMSEAKPKKSPVL